MELPENLKLASVPWPEPGQHQGAAPVSNEVLARMSKTASLLGSPPITERDTHEEMTELIQRWKSVKGLRQSDPYRIAVSHQNCLFWSSWLNLNPGENATIELSRDVPLDKVVLWQSEADVEFSG